MGCVVSTDGCGAAQWIGLFGMDTLGFGSFWAIGDWGTPLGGILIGADDWRRWCLVIFGVCQRSLGVMCIGCALCRAIHLGWRRWSVGIGPFGRLQDFGVDANWDMGGWVWGWSIVWVSIMGSAV